MTVTAVAAVAVVSSTPANADPKLPDKASDAANQVRDLSHQAEQLTEDMKKAEDDHSAKKAELDRSTAAAGQAEQVANQARAEQERFRGQVDRLTSASYRGARLNKLSALLVSDSPNDFLNRASALDVLAKDNNDAVKQLSAAVDQAQSAEKRAKDSRATAAQAEQDAARLQDELNQKKSAMDAQIAKVKQRYSQLSAADQQSLNGGGDTNYDGPVNASGAAAVAVQTALAQQGKSYVYGAKGPGTFDCSGLMQFAYKKAGISLGGSTKSQVSEGHSVSASELQPGDLIFYYSPVSHVSMYIGNGKAVHAPTEGDVVKVSDYQDIANVTAMRRVT